MVNTAKLFLLLVVAAFIVIVGWTARNVSRPGNGTTAYKGTVVGLSLAGVVLTSIVVYQSSCMML